MTDEVQNGMKLLEFRLTLLKDEITAQANTFDQIDSKTGVALGFMFIAVAQVLAAMFLIPDARGHFSTWHSCVGNCTFFFANASALFATAFGVASRWPRGFLHSIEFDIGADESYSDALKGAIRDFKEITVTNESINDKKHNWAIPTYLCTGLALALYVAFTLILYF
jgi:hypothetical protein